MELWDVYDEARRPTGKTVRRDADPLGAGEYHLVVHACVFSSDGKMLIQRRALEKTYGGLWDVTAGGSALAGETGKQAAERELLEEVGIRAAFSRPAFTVYHKNAIEDVFLTHTEPDLAALTLQAAEVSEVRWAGEEEVLSLLRAGEFVIHYEGYIKLLFEKQKEI